MSGEKRKSYGAGNPSRLAGVRVLSNIHKVSRMLLVQNGLKTGQCLRVDALVERN